MFKILDVDKNPPSSYKICISFFYDINITFTTKPRWMNLGHKTPDSMKLMYELD